MPPKERPNVITLPAHDDYQINMLKQDPDQYFRICKEDPTYFQRVFEYRYARRRADDVD